MALQIEHGLFKFDFTDHHAVLGIPVNADVKEVRKRYLTITRKLHPDSNRSGSEAQKKQANELLSKLVNPAYEQLSKTNNRDYLVSLSHMGRRLASEGGRISITSDLAKQLAKSGPNLDGLYKTSLQNLASKQYASLEQVLEKIGEISELNMVYLMLKASKGEGIRPPSGNQPGTTGGVRPTPGTPGGVRPTPQGTAMGGTRTPQGTVAGGASLGQSGTLPDSQERMKSRVVEYISRAEGYMKKQNFAGAVLELREALKLDQNNTSSHTLLGIAYLKQNQPGMAKVHLNKALQLNPKDERALKAKQYLDKLIEKSGGRQQRETPRSDSVKPPSQPGGGGLFGGFFGGKKK
jgi:curved DNA-binding protein CbpA